MASLRCFWVASSQTLSRFCTEERGSIAVMMMLMLVPALGIGGLVFDGKRIHTAHLELEIVAESAAIAAALQLPSESSAKSAAVDYAEQNLPPSSYGEVVRASDVEIGSYDEGTGTFTAGAGTSAVRVTAWRHEDRSNSLPTIFAGAIGRDSVNLSASAIAVSQSSSEDPICILVLGNKFYGLDLDLRSEVDIPDCGIQVNSDEYDAVQASSLATVNASFFNVVGSVLGSTSGLTPTPTEGADAVDDPYASLAEPTAKPCGGVDEIDGGTHTLVDTYRFCDGLEIDDATVTFSPGEYQIDGDFDLKGTASISGTDVTIFIDGSRSDINFGRYSSFHLEAPTTGTYAGVLLWTARDNDESFEFRSRFGASSSGSFYFPAAKMDIEDNVTWEADCLRIVAWVVDFSPRSSFSSTSPGTACENNIGVSSGGVRLVR